MSRSAYLRVADCRTILQLVGECCELGDDRDAWRRHLVEQMARLVDADMGVCGEALGVHPAGSTDLGSTLWGLDNGFDRAVLAEVYDAIAQDWTIYGAMLTYFQRVLNEDGLCCSARDCVDAGAWYSSRTYQLAQLPRGVDHALWCFRSLPKGAGDEFGALVLERAHGRRDFTARDRLIVREVHAVIAPLIGWPLARFTDPSPLDLAPRARQVLGCLLEGDGDKQIAARLKLSKFTVNQYTKLIFRHFGVSSRPELLARWVRRGWGNKMSWLD